MRACTSLSFIRTDSVRGYICGKDVRRLKMPSECPCLFRRSRGNLDRDTRDQYFFVAFVTTQQFRMTSARSTTAISVLVLEIGENYTM
jgi:hypothetical protein